MALHFIARPAKQLTGSVRVPGDKSISHRAVMLGSIATGVTRVSGFLSGADAIATIHAFRAMGVRIEHEENRLEIHGVGRDGLSAPEVEIDLGNSGTAMRLMMGLLSGQRFNVRLTGDASLCSRPSSDLSFFLFFCKKRGREMPPHRNLSPLPPSACFQVARQMKKKLHSAYHQR